MAKNKKDYEDEFVDVAKVTEEKAVQNKVAVEAQIQQKVNKVRENLTKEDKVKIRISPSYKPYLGSKCQIAINGVPIIVPVDGSMVEIPSSYAAELYRRMARIDEMIDAQLRMSDYGSNRDQTIGQLRFY